MSDWFPPPEVGGAKLAREDWNGGNGGGGGGTRAGVRAKRRERGAPSERAAILAPMAAPVRPRGKAGRPHASASRLAERLRAAVALPEEEGEIPARLLAEHLVVRGPQCAAMAPRTRPSSQRPQIRRFRPQIRPRLSRIPSFCTKLSVSPRVSLFLHRFSPKSPFFSSDSSFFAPRPHHLTIRPTFPHVFALNRPFLPLSFHPNPRPPSHSPPFPGLLL